MEEITIKAKVTGKIAHTHNLPMESKILHKTEVKAKGEVNHVAK
jgi:hypothetical protein